MRLFRTSALCLGATLVSFSTPTMAGCGTDDYLGSICMTAATFCPSNTQEAAGQTLAIASNEALFSLLGTQYGGDGRVSFSLPDLRGRTPVGQGQGSGLQRITAGERRGVEMTRLSVPNLPPHSHSATFTPDGSGAAKLKASTVAGNKKTPQDGDYLAAGDAPATAAAQIYSDSLNEPVTLGGVSAVTGGGSVTVGNTGAGAAFTNYPPQLGMRYCIVTQGIYPSRN